MKELIFSRTLYPIAGWRQEATAIRDGDFVSTYTEHVERVERVGHAIQDVVGGRGERFAILALNSHEFLELWHSAMCGCAVFTPLNYRLSPVEIADILVDSGATLLFVDEAMRDLWSQVRAVRPELDLTVVGLRWSDDTTVDYEEFLASGSGGMLAEPDELDTMALMYTGGTSGRPKGVMLPHRATVLNMYHQLDVVRPGIDTVYLHQSPIFHAAAMSGLMLPTAGGGVQCTLPRFEPKLVLETVERFGVTDSQMVPSMIGMLLDACGDKLHRLDSLRQLIYGAEPMRQGILDRVVSGLPKLRLLHGYGMTETSSVVSFLRYDELLADQSRLRSVGRPVTGVTVSIQDPSGTVLEPGQTGEICIRGGNVMSGYWKQPEVTDEAMRDGWLHSGDAGYIDDDGYLFIVDRVKDMIISGGENIYSIEVENAISTHPSVSQVAVVGVPDARWGEIVHAVVVPREGRGVAQEDLEAHVRTQLAGYKVPKAWTIRSEPLPTSGAMKVLKRTLREELA